MCQCKTCEYLDTCCCSTLKSKQIVFIFWTVTHSLLSFLLSHMIACGFLKETHLVIYAYFVISVVHLLGGILLGIGFFFKLASTYLAGTVISSIAPFSLLGYLAELGHILG
ncbi:uncharacterized protein Dvir_GJ26371, isoform C [Drosophila virilis]|uniref:Uncharacterized protein, isoform C n=1 Tax=Drosophila virilis TaxID=7244 RepID=A0A0Q9WUP2_DROVI|nr:uncharacterized protein Dvir_GJ26371, isoform C [Drosophila virilis]